MSIAWRRSLLLVVVLVFAQARAIAQDLDFRPPANATDPQAASVMRDLAVRILPVYQDSDQDRFLMNLSALQLAAQDYPSAAATRQALRDRRKPDSRTIGRDVLFDVYARAKAIESSARIPFARAFAQAYREIVPRLSDVDAFLVTKWFGVPLSTLQDNLQRAFDQRRAKGSVPQSQAIDLVWTYLAYESFRNFGPLVSDLDAEDARRRYVTEETLVATADKASISVVIVRPKSAKPLPALLEYSQFVSQNDTRESAARGYVGVVAYARGVYGSPDRAVPFEYDGNDARAVIAWIAEQSWSDGRVGMYGSGYAGFVAWAAAKRIPEALKAIAATDPTAPGIDVPMTGNIFRNSAYRWAFQVTNSQQSGEKFFNDDKQWRAFELDYYTSGRRYREFAGMVGGHSALFRRWLSHPSYDKYWQAMVPFKEQYARINIPVLTTTGYFSDGEVGALYYFTEHLRHNARADHTLLIGPYDDGAMRRGPLPTLDGYNIDAAALVDLRAMRYQWFDSVLKGVARPGLLRDRVNYQTMGANEWRHAPSIEAMGNAVLKFYLEENPAGDRNLLTARKSEETKFLPQIFYLADRTDGASWAGQTTRVSRALKPRNGEMFVSEPLGEATEISGLLSGRLDFTVNKQDMDFYVSLYELTAAGDFIELSEPYEVRASYAKDRVRRQLLKAGVRQQLPFKSERLTSRRLQAGSRVVVVLGINKRPDRQINYGTGDDVSEESIDDARVPLRIRWYNSTYVDIPVRR